MTRTVEQLTPEEKVFYKHFVYLCTLVKKARKSDVFDVTVTAQVKVLNHLIDHAAIWKESPFTYHRGRILQWLEKKDRAYQPLCFSALIAFERASSEYKRVFTQE